jgi:hypothetical protein
MKQAEQRVTHCPNLDKQPGQPGRKAVLLLPSVPFLTTIPNEAICAHPSEYVKLGTGRVQRAQTRHIGIVCAL